MSLELKCPHLVAMNMPGFKVVPSQSDWVGFGDGVQGKGAISPSHARLYSFPGSCLPLSVIAHTMKWVVGEDLEAFHSVFFDATTYLATVAIVARQRIRWICKPRFWKPPCCAVTFD